MGLCVRDTRIGAPCLYILYLATQRNRKHDMHADKYFPCRKKICMWEFLWSWIKQRILFNEEETIKMIRRLVGVIKIE